MGSAHGIYPWDSTLVRRSLDGETYWVCCGCFFLGGTGEGTRTHQGKYCRVVFTGDAWGITNSPIFYVIYYILISGGFAAACVKGAHDPRCPGQQCVLFNFRQLDDLFHVLKTVKGLLHLVPSRTPRSSGYGVLCNVVYVTCYFCYMFSLG